VLQIGGIHGFRHPPEWWDPTTGYEVARVPTPVRGRFVDHGTDADWWESVAGIKCNETLAAWLVDYLTRNVRADEFEITCWENQWPFTVDNASLDGSGVMMCVLNDNVIEIQHKELHDFMVRLPVSLMRWYPITSPSSVSVSSYSGSSTSRSSSSDSTSSSSTSSHSDSSIP
jgi:hypothetical protein